MVFAAARCPSGATLALLALAVTLAAPGCQGDQPDAPTPNVAPVTEAGTGSESASAGPELSVSGDGRLARAGAQPGDVVLEVDDLVVDSPLAVRRAAVRLERPVSRVTVRREGTGAGSDLVELRLVPGEPVPADDDLVSARVPGIERVGGRDYAIDPELAAAALAAAEEECFEAREATFEGQPALRFGPIERTSVFYQLGLRRSQSLLALNGEPAPSCSDLLHTLREAQPGAWIGLEIAHRGRRQVITYRILGEAPQQAPSRAPASLPSHP